MNTAAASASTGPRTPEGKATSSQNALKHGFRAATVFIPKGMEQDYKDFHDRYEAAFLLPNATPAQIIIFEDLLKDAWNTHRIEILIATINDEQPDDPMNQWDFNKLHRNLLRSKSSYNRNLKLLQAIQTTQLLQEILPAEITAGKTISGLINFQQVLNLTKRTTRALREATNFADLNGV